METILHNYDACVMSEIGEYMQLCTNVNNGLFFLYVPSSNKVSNKGICAYTWWCVYEPYVYFTWSEQQKLEGEVWVKCNSYLHD